jgi:hypothetical protein
VVFVLILATESQDSDGKVTVEKDTPKTDSTYFGETCPNTRYPQLSYAN